MPRALSENDVEAFRARICEAAVVLYIEESPAAVTMRRLAGELGCGTMTPYRFFASKGRHHHRRAHARRAPVFRSAGESTGFA